MSFHPNDKFDLGRADSKASETNKDVTLGHLPGSMLLDVARNESTSREWRKAAVELLIDKNLPQAKHPELYMLVVEISQERAAKKELEAELESVASEPLPESRPETGLRAGVTTATMQQQEFFPAD